MKFKKRGPRTLVNWDVFSSLASCWKDSAKDNIDEEYNRFIAHLRDCAQEAESPKNTRKRLSHETLELIRQRGVARTEGDYLRTSELARLCREAIKEDLKGRKVAALVDAAEAGKSSRNARRGLINYKTKMTALLRSDGTLTSSRRAMEKVMHDFYSDLFDSHVHLPEYPIPNDGHVIPASYKLVTRVILNRIDRRIDKGQPCEQSGFRRGFSTIDHIHTVIRLSEVTREYKTPLCLTFFDLKKAFDAVETEAVIEALCKQGVSTQYVKILSELYKGFMTTITITPFYNNVRINVKKGVRQDDTILPKLFNASLENIMRTLEWDDMEVKIDGR
ncbi:hypothetical protein Q1695_009247 [Nippostrongylus brasiliensis]|nr:hypothetical protein Q1695_009247 [Nippostrongylus brasiliensis]